MVWHDPRTGSRIPLQSTSRARSLVVPLFAAALAGGCVQTAKLVAQGDTVSLRARPERADRQSGKYAPLLVLAVDGVGRELVYSLVRERRLPGLSKLLADDGRFSHAYFDRTYVATMPSTT